MAYTPDFLTVNGLAVPATGAGQRRSDVESWGRGSGTEYTGSVFGRKRTFAFETPPMTAGEARSLSGWVRGLGHHFTFEYLDEHLNTTQFTLYSTDGGGKMPGGSTCTVTSKFGSYSLLIPGSDSHTTTALFGSEGPYSFSVWRNQLDDNEWVLCSACYDGSTTRFFAGADGTGITSEFGWKILLATTGFLRVGLEGQTHEGSGVSCAYDGLMIVPYSLTTAQLAARNARLNAEPGFPLVAVGGHVTRSQPEIACKGAVASYDVHRVVLDGVWRDNARTVMGSLAESHVLTDETILPEPEIPPVPVTAPEVYYPLGTPEEIYTSGGNDIGSTNYWGSAGTYHYISNPTGGDAIVTNPGPPTSPEVTWNDDGDLDYHDVVGTGTSISYPTSYDTLTTETINHDSYARAYLPKTGDLTFYCHFRMRSGVIAASPSGVFHIFSNLDMPTFNGNIFSGWRAYATLGGVAGQVGRYDDGLGGTEGFLSAVASGTLSEETWYDMAVVFDRAANEMRVYLDGVLGATVADISSLSGDDIGAAMRSYGKPTLGGWLDYSLPYGQFHYVTAGDLREVAFWQSAVSAAEIGQLHQNRLDGVPLHTYLGLT